MISRLSSTDKLKVMMIWFTRVGKFCFKSESLWTESYEVEVVKTNQISF